LKVLNFNKKSESKAHRWTFGHSVNKHPKDASTRVPTQITCQIFKKRLGLSGPKKGPGSIALGLFPST
jgi:hypothetical protein